MYFTLDYSLISTMIMIMKMMADCKYLHSCREWSMSLTPARVIVHCAYCILHIKLRCTDALSNPTSTQCSLHSTLYNRYVHLKYMSLEHVLQMLSLFPLQHLFYSKYMENEMHLITKCLLGHRQSPFIDSYKYL